MLLTSNECYLRRIRDQSTSLTWDVGLLRRPLVCRRSARANVKGAVKGARGRDSCDDVAEELPPDAPDDWLHNGQLQRSAARFVVAGKGHVGERRPPRSGAGGRGGEESGLHGTARGARSSAHGLRLAGATRVAKLRPGAQIRVAVGWARPATGSYRERVNCFHIAKPYDGYRSFDQCTDTLRWSGIVTITRL